MNAVAVETYDRAQKLLACLVLWVPVKRRAGHRRRRVWTADFPFHTYVAQALIDR